jgi:uncharacterized membrane protein YeaQ/YmgE (transglycosylase-associated protein family)
MIVLAWIIVGVATGLLAGSIAREARGGFVTTVALGVVGWVGLGGASYWFCDGLLITPVYAWSLFASMGCSVVLVSAQTAPAAVPARAKST